MRRTPHRRRRPGLRPCRRTGARSAPHCDARSRHSARSARAWRCARSRAGASVPERETPPVHRHDRYGHGCRSRCARAPASSRAAWPRSPARIVCVPVSTSTSPSSVSNTVQPENCDANQVRGATSTGPPLQKNFASSGDLPRIVANFAAGFCAIGFPVIYFGGAMLTDGAFAPYGIPWPPIRPYVSKPRKAAACAQARHGRSPTRST